jgi:ComF family protein
MAIKMPAQPPRSLMQRTLDLVFPPRCAGCRRPGSWICAACWPRVPWLLPAQQEMVLTIHVQAVAAYEGVARQAVHELKYHQHYNIATVLGPLMAARLTTPTPATLVPVPLHPARQRARGYNQAELLARQVGRAIDADVVARHLRRIQDTADQITLDANQRHRNVQDAFQWKGPPLNGTVVLVDDVCTTGATLEACSACLRAAGMSQVRGLVFARTVR